MKPYDNDEGLEPLENQSEATEAKYLRFEAMINLALEEKNKHELMTKAAFAIDQYAESIISLQNPEPFPYRDSAFKVKGEKNLREFGALLYGLAAVNLYAKNPYHKQEEVELLLQIKNHFKSLYDDPKVNTAMQIKGLFENTEKWLALPNDSQANKECEKFCRALHTILSIINYSIPPANWVKDGSIKTATGVDLGYIRAQIKKTLPFIANKSDALKNDIALETKETIERPSISNTEANQPQSEIKKPLQVYFNERFSKILDGKEPEIEKLDKLQVDMKNVSETITTIRDTRTKKDNIDSQIEDATKKHNEIDALINHLNPFLKSVLRTFIPAKTDLKLNTPATDASSSSKWHRPKLLKDFQQAVGLDHKKNIIKLETTPSPDSYLEKSDNLMDKSEDEKRQELKNIGSVLLKLKNESEKLDAEMDTACANLSHEGSFKNILKSASLDELDDVLKKNAAAYEALIEYRALSKTIHQTIDETEKQLKINSTFINQNDNWKVKLSNFFAQFSSFFKTKTATQVDIFKTFKKEIEPQKQLCDAWVTELKNEMKKIAKNPNVSKPSDNIAKLNDIKNHCQSMRKSLKPQVSGYSRP